MSDRICLVVDDEPAVRRYVCVVLQKDNYQTLEAESAPQAFKLIMGMNGGLDLLITDISMPGDMDGADLAFAVRNAFPTVPIVVISGYSSSARVKSGMKDFEFIEKPFKPEAISMAVVRATTSAGLPPGTS